MKFKWVPLAQTCPGLYTSTSIFFQMYSTRFKLHTPSSELCSSLCICLSETFLSQWWWWCWAQSCLTLCSPMDCSLLGSSVHGRFQARILEWVATSCSRESLQPRDQTCISCIYCIGRWVLHHCATWEDPLLSQLMATPFFWLPRSYRVTLGSSLFSQTSQSILQEFLMVPPKKQARICRLFSSSTGNLFVSHSVVSDSLQPHRL